MESTTYLSYYFYLYQDIDKYFSAFYAGLYQFTWSISIVWFVFATSAGFGGMYSIFSKNRSQIAFSQTNEVFKLDP